MDFLNNNTTNSVGNKDKPATEKQIKYLKYLKFNGNPELLTQKEASDKIKELGG